jgi:hypothetical protein
MVAYLKAERKENVVFLSKRGLFCLELPSKNGRESEYQELWVEVGWIMPVIPATLEAETGGQPGKIN